MARRYFGSMVRNQEAEGLTWGNAISGVQET